MKFPATAPPLALKMINSYGKTASFISVTQGTYDPTTGTSGVTTATTVIKCLISDYNRQADGAAFVNGLVMEGDKKIQVAALALPVVPKPGDQISFDTSLMTVKNVKTTFAGEAAALYELHVRN